MFKNKEEIQSYLKEHPFVLAPMVDHSDLPFRMLSRRHGAGLCFTPMLHSRLFVEDEKYRKKMFVTHPQDRPLVVQIAGCDPDLLLKTVKLLEPFADIIDINFGCPQGIAKRGNYGSFLLENEALVLKIVEHLAANSKVPIACKIRIFKDKSRTLKLVKEIEKRGCQLLTVHGRTREQNKDKVGSADWDIIKEIKESINIPVISNGNIASYSDLAKCLDQTGCDGVMSAEAILEYPALFSSQNEHGLIDMDELVQEYFQCVEEFPDQELFVKSHIFKMLYMGLKTFTDLRDQLTSVRTISDCKKIAEEVRERRKEWTANEKIGWYYRYFKQQENVPVQETDPKEQKSDLIISNAELVSEKVYQNSFVDNLVDEQKEQKKSNLGFEMSPVEGHDLTIKHEPERNGITQDKDEPSKRIKSN
jgi:tRNA-dihydrouridine synthase 1